MFCILDLCAERKINENWSTWKIIFSSKRLLQTRESYWKNKYRVTLLKLFVSENA